MPNGASLIGERFGKLIVVSRAENTQTGKRAWNCQCDCGGTTVTPTGDLRSGKARACACVRNEKTSNLKRSHNLAGSKEYEAWANMVNRCTYKSNTHYADYGGRGITVCERWLKFENFIRDIGRMPSPNHTIERKDVNGNYCPENVVWLERRLQARNKRTSRRIEWNGRSMLLVEWAEYLGIKLTTLSSRFRCMKLKPPELFAPECLIMITFKGETKRVSEWAREIGIDATTIRWRIRKGITDPEILLSKHDLRIAVKIKNKPCGENPHV